MKRNSMTPDHVSQPRYRVKDLARLAKVSVRTLHHYDQIGLLTPAERSEAGYRLYDESNLLRLQQILIHRELGLPLEQIRQILSDPSFDKRAALMRQREQLRQRARELTDMLGSIDAALDALENETEGPIVNAERLFDGFDPAKYEDEARERWGDTEAYAESARRTKNYGPADWAEMKAESKALLRSLADRMEAGIATDAPAAMDLAEAHRLHIDRWFYPCTHEMHAGLAQMYIADPRFTASFEDVATGLAAYISGAIQANSTRAAGKPS